MRLFDPVTGRLSPDAEIDFDIDPSSYVSAKAPYIVKLWNVTDKLTKIGLTTKPLPDKLTFGGARKLNASYTDNKVDLHEPVSLVLDDWAVALEGGSWVELGSERQASSAPLTASAEVSEFVNEHLGKLTDIAPKEVRGKLLEETRGQLFAGDRLTLQATTQGALSDPKVTLKTRLPDIEQMLKEYAKTRILNFAIDKLLK